MYVNLFLGLVFTLTSEEGACLLGGERERESDGHGMHNKVKMHADSGSKSNCYGCARYLLLLNSLLGWDKAIP